MVDFYKSLLPELLGYAEDIADGSSYRKAWLEGDFSETSVIDPSELFTQLMEGLYIDEMKDNLSKQLEGYPALREALTDFIAGITRLEDWYDDEVNFPTNEEVLSSPHWETLREYALRVVKAAKIAGLSSDDFDPSSGDNSGDTA